MVVNSELEIVWKKAGQFKALFWNLPGMAEENRMGAQSG
jgi:hypothetical protein